MKVILVPLLLLMFASVLGFARFLGYVDFTGDIMGSGYYNSSGQQYYANGSLIVGGNETQVTTEIAEVGMSGIISAGVITLVATAVALAVVSGIQVFGSGLSNASVRAIFISAAYFGIWALFSVLALVLFMEVPVFGLPLYFLLTLFYSVGVVEKIGG